jgi:hypothetical protein
MMGSRAKGAGLRRATGRGIGVLLLLPLTSGCAALRAQSWWPWKPEDRSQATPLALGEWHKDRLACGDGDCLDWYRIRVPEKGTLQIEVYSPAGAGLPDFDLRLEDVTERALEEAPPTGRSPRQIRQKVSPGSYWLLLRSTGENKEPLNYDLLASLKHPRPRRVQPKPEPTPPPPPKVDVISAEILEVEKQGGEPRSVLIDAGRPQGVKVGLSGELFEKGKSIAQIKVIDVYEAGSRAEIVGSLGASITIDTEARIRIPRSSP